MKRKVFPLKNGQVIPDYEWEYDYSLKWNGDKACFERVSSYFGND